jgi:hypothetical protein
MDRDMKENLAMASSMALAQSLPLMDRVRLEHGRTDSSMRRTRTIGILMGENMGSMVVTLGIHLGMI